MSTEQDLQNRMQKAVDDMMDRIGKSHLRPMTKNAYLKMASCYDFSSNSTIDSCVQNAAQPLQVSQQMVQREMQSLQNRLQRCSMDCSDSVQDSFDLSNPKDRDAAQKKLLSCNTACIDKHIAMLKSIEAKLGKELDALRAQAQL